MRAVWALYAGVWAALVSPTWADVPNPTAIAVGSVLGLLLLACLVLAFIYLHMMVKRSKLASLYQLEDAETFKKPLPPQQPTAPGHQSTPLNTMRYQPSPSPYQHSPTAVPYQPATPYNPNASHYSPPASPYQHSPTAVPYQPATLYNPNASHYSPPASPYRAPDSPHQLQSGDSARSPAQPLDYDDWGGYSALNHAYTGPEQEEEEGYHDSQA